MDVHIAFTWDGLNRPGLYLAHHHYRHHLHPMPHHHHHHHHHDHPQHHHHQPLLASPLNHHHHLMNGAPSSTMTARTDPNSAAPHREMASFPSSSELSIPVSRVLTSPLIEGETQSNFKSHHFMQNVSNPEIMQDLDNTRQRNQVSRPPSLSLSISQSSRQRAVRYSMEIVLAPSLASGGKLPGLARLYMGVIFAFLGVTMAFQKGRAFTLINKKLCLQCKGYGVECCDLCQGRGQISWEGKLRRADPCPLCLGSCLKKCSHCGGIRVKKGAPPSFQPSPPKDFF